jgi:gentisate 1,2-dioxygenase
VAFALRFIIEGDRGFTAVEGQKMSMQRYPSESLEVISEET